MFKHFATSIFQRRQAAEAGCSNAGKMTQSELKDLFRSEFEVHNLSAAEINARHGNRRVHSLAA